MSRQRILVINPNSNRLVTQGLEDALKPLSLEGGATLATRVRVAIFDGAPSAPLMVQCSLCSSAMI